MSQMPGLNSPFAAVKKKGRPKGSKMNPNSPRALAAKARRAVTPAAGAAISDVDLFGAVEAAPAATGIVQTFSLRLFRCNFRPFLR